MLLAETGNEWIFWLALLIAMVWMIYMATFRTNEFIRLMDKDRERKREAAQMLGKAAKGGFSMARWFLNRR